MAADFVFSLLSAPPGQMDSMHIRSQGFTLGYSLDLPSGGENGDPTTRTIRSCGRFFCRLNFVSILGILDTQFHTWPCGILLGKNPVRDGE
jgi:hypothetical protein